jgi:CheY-like chemotaxis protein
MTHSTTAYILLADDDDEDQELLKEALSEQDPDTDVASVWNGQEVFSYLETCPDSSLPCLILLDYKMPVLNGPEVLDRLGMDPRYATIPKAVWSTSSQQEYIDRCLGKGATQFFIKPNNPSDLQKIANQLLSLCHHSG